MNILAIDPGCTESAWCWYDTVSRRPLAKEKMPNDILVLSLETGVWIDNAHVVIEAVASYGMAVGKEVFETVYWSGRFAQASKVPVTRVYRRDVKMHLCNSMKAKDSNIRQAILDRYGGKSAIGKKSAPGPLYGFAADTWAALALGITFADGGAVTPVAA